MRRRRVLQDAYDFPFGKDVPVVQCQEQRLADGKSSEPSHVGNISHRSSTFFRVSVMMGTSTWSCARFEQSLQEIWRLD
jgi:hypothetical protein